MKSKLISPGFQQTVLDIAAKIKAAYPDVVDITGGMIKDYINTSADKSEDRLDVLFTHAYFIEAVLSENGYSKEKVTRPKAGKYYY